MYVYDFVVTAKEEIENKIFLLKKYPSEFLVIFYFTAHSNGVIIIKSKVLVYNFTGFDLSDCTKSCMLAPSVSQSVV
jgi:hypothetical protein